jgi:putative spermidine/putrescine transport system ATP-binding protein/putrescine transport system ATP-binding protein
MKVLEVRNVTKRFGGVVAVDNLSFDIEAGQTVALLGPSGCGKTTNLRMIAGFEVPDEGSIVISGKDMHGRAPYERNVGLLFQDYALFPHMTVAENIAYGLKRRRFERGAITARVAEMLDLVKLTALQDRFPGQLSGGQQQRVALARALATRPEVLLLDEPLSALDAKLRESLRLELRAILGATGSTTIVVTHDQEEAMSLAERVIVMNRGCIMQEGGPVEIYARPANRFVAEFIGRTNWFAGRLGEETFPGIRRFVRPNGDDLLVAAESHLSAQYDLCVRPERIVVQAESESATTPNLLNGTVVGAAAIGADVHVYVLLDSGERIVATRKNSGRPIERNGDAIRVAFAPADGALIISESPI